MNANWPAKNTDRSRLVLIDLIRTISILMVLALHLGFGRLFIIPRTDLGAYAWVWFARNGGYGVFLFFLISGYLITRILVGTNQEFSSIPLKEFYVRRAARILPLLALSVLIGTLFSAQPSTSQRLSFCFRTHPLPWGLWLSIGSFSFNWYKHLFTNGFGVHWDILWSLSVEEQFYLLYPLALKICRSTKNTIVMLIVFILLGPLARCYPVVFPNPSYLKGIVSSLGSFDLIAMGGLLFFVQRIAGSHLEKQKPLARLLVALGAVVLASVYFSTNGTSLRQMIFVPSLLDLGLFLVLLAGLTLPWKENTVTKLMCVPGSLSYGVYLLHGLTLFLFWNVASPNSPWISFAVFSLLTVALASLSNFFYEKPMNIRIRKLFA